MLQYFSFKAKFFDFAFYHIFCINMLGFAYIYSVTASFLHNCFDFVLKFLLRLCAFVIALKYFVLNSVLPIYNHVWILVIAYYGAHHMYRPLMLRCLLSGKQLNKEKFLFLSIHRGNLHDRYRDNSWALYDSCMQRDEIFRLG